MKNQTLGVLLLDKTTNKILLLRRSKFSTFPHLWSLLSGGIEDGETHLETILREIREEISVDLSGTDFEFISKESTKTRDFYFYGGLVDSNFDVILNKENEDYGWFSLDDLPKPLYPKLKIKLDVIKSKYNL